MHLRLDARCNQLRVMYPLILVVCTEVISVLCHMILSVRNGIAHCSDPTMNISSTASFGGGIYNSPKWMFKFK